MEGWHPPPSLPLYIQGLTLVVLNKAFLLSALNTNFHFIINFTSDFLAYNYAYDYLRYIKIYCNSAIAFWMYNSRLIFCWNNLIEGAHSL